MSTTSTLSDRRHESLRTIDLSKIAEPFLIVTWANYFLLILGGNGLLTHTTALFLEPPSIKRVALHLMLLPICGYAAWTGWKNTGVLAAVRNKHTYYALCGFFLLHVLIVWGTFLNLEDVWNYRSDDSVRILTAELIENSLVILASLGGIIALVYLRRLTIPELGIELKQFLNGAFLHPPNDFSKLPARAPRKGVFYLVAGLVYLTLFQLIPDKFFVSSQFRLSQLSCLGYAFFIWARQCFQPDFDSVILADSRSPVLFLRSFADDEKLDYKEASATVFDFSLESRLADHFFGIGPFIAVGSPKDSSSAWGVSPHLGAVRAELLDNEWQDAVIRWMQASTLILCMAGMSEWFAWELRTIVEMGYADKRY